MTDPNFRWRWAHVDQSKDASGYVELLNRIRQDDDPAHFPQTMAWINAQPGERLLEVGCGNGAVARALAQQCPAIQEIVAIDASALMIAQAQQHLRQRDLPIRFIVADAHQLPFPDASFDRCYAQELFVILPDPHQALMELARVTRAGGHLCLWEFDHDTHALLGADLKLTRRLLRFVSDTEYNGAVARQLIGWLKELGWQVQIVPTVGVSEDAGILLTTLLPEWLADAQQAGVVSKEETAQFLEEMHQRQRQGQFLSYSVNVRITAIRP